MVVGERVVRKELFIINLYFKQKYSFLVWQLPKWLVMKVKSRRSSHFGWNFYLVYFSPDHAILSILFI